MYTRKVSTMYKQQKDDSKNPITKSLKNFLEEQQKKKDDKIQGSTPYYGKVESGRYGAVGDKKYK